MPRFKVPNSASLHTARALFRGLDAAFAKDGEAILDFHPRWAHLEPLALAMIAAWGSWCRREGLEVEGRNLGKHARYAARMKLFEPLGIEYEVEQEEHEEAAGSYRSPK